MKHIKYFEAGDNTDDIKDLFEDIVDDFNLTLLGGNAMDFFNNRMNVVGFFYLSDMYDKEGSRYFKKNHNVIINIWASIRNTEEYESLHKEFIKLTYRLEEFKKIVEGLGYEVVQIYPRFERMISNKEAYRFIIKPIITK